MSDMPNKIAAWRFAPSKADEWLHGGWSEDHDHKTTSYIPEALAQAMVAAALERAEELASIHSDWSADEIEHYRRETQRDARAALSAMLAKAREDTLREAAEKARRTVESCQSCACVELKILALIDRTAEGKA